MVRLRRPALGRQPQLRLAVNGLLAKDYLNGRIVDSNGMMQSGFSTARIDATYSVELEMKL